MRLLSPLFILTLTSCAEMPKFPAKFIYEVDLRSGVCGQYKVTNAERLTFKHVQDLPLEKCDGVFGFSKSEISPVLNWSRDAIQLGKKKCN